MNLLAITKMAASLFLMFALMACPGRAPLSSSPPRENEPDEQGKVHTLDEKDLGEALEKDEDIDTKETARAKESIDTGDSPAPIDFDALRREMVETQLSPRGVDDERVLSAMQDVPRHKFVPERYRALAYADHPLPIGEGQTISQPLIVALMSQLARVEPDDKILEIGTGSGYHAAVLANLGAEVYTIEIVETLGRGARLTLASLGYENVHVKIGDGYEGWPEHAPFEAIVITAAPPTIPEPLLEQLAVGGRMVLPVGEHDQELKVISRTESGLQSERHGAVRFVPMTGKAQEQSAR